MAICIMNQKTGLVLDNSSPKRTNTTSLTSVTLIVKIFSVGRPPVSVDSTRME